LDLSGFIRDVPDFPKKGILFKDITPLLKDPDALAHAADAMAGPWRAEGVHRVVGLESRGFVFAPLVAERLRVGFVPIRKPGKLPAATIGEDYELEYGTDRLEMHRDAVEPGESILVVDDLLATGGTAAAAVNLVRKAGGNVAGASFLVELDFLHGRDKLKDVEVKSLLHY
jgi:adenine phosphoribosyltransferase